MWLFDPEQTPQRKYAPDLMKDRDIVRISRQFPLWVARLAARAGRRRRPAHLVLAGRGDRVLLGLAGAGLAAAPRDLVDQLDLPHASASGRSSPATSPPTSGGWPSRRWASRGTTCTTPTRPARGTACCVASSTPRPGSSGRWRSRLGPRRALAGQGADRRQARGTSPGRPARRRLTQTRDLLSSTGAGSDGVVTAGRGARRSPAPPPARMTAAERREQLIEIARGAVRRARLRRHVDRGDRRARRGLEAGRLRALRRQGGALRRRGRPRGAQPARHDAGRADRRAARGCCSSRRRSRCSTTSSSPRTASGSWCATARSARPRARSSRSSATSRRGWSTSWPRSSSARGFDANAAPMYAQMLVGMVGTTGQWWLDARKPSKEVVAAHLVNLAWHGLAGLERNPRCAPPQPLSLLSTRASCGSSRASCGSSRARAGYRHETRVNPPQGRVTRRRPGSTMGGQAVRPRAEAVTAARPRAAGRCCRSAGASRPSRTSVGRAWTPRRCS